MQQAAIRATTLDRDRAKIAHKLHFFHEVGIPLLKKKLMFY